MQSRLVSSAVNIALLALVNLCWGMQFTAYKLVGGDIGPITTSLLIYFIAVPAVFPLYLGERWKGRGASRSIPAEERSLLRWDNLARFLVIGMAAACTMIFMARGMARTTAANGALLTLTIPVVTALLAAAFLRRTDDSGALGEPGYRAGRRAGSFDPGDRLGRPRRAGH